MALADSLSSAVLYTVEAEGHTAFLTVDCVEDVVVTIPVDLVLPDAGSSCSDNDTADFFPPPGESDIDLIMELFDCLRENGADVPEMSNADVLADPTGETIFGNSTRPIQSSRPRRWSARTSSQICEGAGSESHRCRRGTLPTARPQRRGRCPQDRRESHIQSALTFHRDAGS